MTTIGAKTKGTELNPTPNVLIWDLESGVESMQDKAKSVQKAIKLLKEKMEYAVEAVNEIFTPIYECAEGVDCEIWSLTRTSEDEEGEPPEDAAERREEMAAMTVEKAIAAHLESMRWVEAGLKEIDRQVRLALGSLTDEYDVSLEEDEKWPPNRED